MKLLAIGCLLCSVLLPLGTAQGRTWLIMPDGTGDAPTIQAAMDSAQAGDAVILEGGTYYEHDIRLKSGVLLTSVTGQPDCAVIDAGTDGGVMSGVNLGPDTRIVGITLTHGVAPCQDDGYGNLVCFGGGMFLLRATLTIVNCVFADNITSVGPSQAIGRGGGIYCYESYLTLTDCTFDGNMSQAGGGMYCEVSTVHLTGCRFYDNVAEWDGGGLHSFRSNFTLTGCVFMRNSALGGRGMGGGVYAHVWSGETNESTIDNCTFSANYAALSGAGVLWLSTSQILYVSRTMIAFSTHGNAFTRFFSTGGAALECCDLYGNEGGDWVGGIEDQADINGNFSLDPRFCAEESDNLALMQCSPCAPGNHPDGANCGQVGALPVACPGTAVEQTTWGRVKAMFR